MERCDILIAGAGVAGASLAWALAERGATGVVVVERERGPALHASGRSARTLLEVDPNPTIQRLKLASAQFFKHPPAHFSERPLLQASGALGLLSRAQAAAVETSAEQLRRNGLSFELVSPAAALRRCELLDERAFDVALHLPDSGFIDVDVLIDSYISHAKAAGVVFRYGVEIGAVERGPGTDLEVRAGRDVVRAATLVNAAGAWAGELALRAGCRPIALTPLRRSLALCEPPAGAAIDAWPLVYSETHNVYFRPLGRDVMLCPMDAEACLPCDARPVASVFAQARDRLAAIAPSLARARITRSWAGLRTFSNDGVPVIGRDRSQPSVFWLAGQGGCGIETSAIVAQVAADLLLEGSSARFDAGLLTPTRAGL